MAELLNFKYRILLIDSQNESRNAIIRILDGEGFEYDWEASAEKGTNDLENSIMI